jgi:hypothetical protein
MTPLDQLPLGTDLLMLTPTGVQPVRFLRIIGTGSNRNALFEHHAATFQARRYRGTWVHGPANEPLIFATR